MIDLDIYHTNQVVEEFLRLLKVRLNKDYPTTKVYISSANPYNHWSQKLYNFYNNIELMEDKHG